MTDAAIPFAPPFAPPSPPVMPGSPQALGEIAARLARATADYRQAVADREEAQRAVASRASDLEAAQRDFETTLDEFKGKVAEGAWASPL